MDDNGIEISAHFRFSPEEAMEMGEKAGRIFGDAFAKSTNLSFKNGLALSPMGKSPLSYNGSLVTSPTIKLTSVQIPPVPPTGSGGVPPNTGGGGDIEDIIKKNREELAEKNKPFTFSTAPMSDTQLENMSQEMSRIKVSSENVVTSFWSVWSISWMIRGSLQNIFGYTSKWTGEVNKLTRAFQSGLYMYAGMARIGNSIAKKTLTWNKDWQGALALQKTIQFRSLPEIARLQASIAKHGGKGLEVGKERIKQLIEQGILDKTNAEVAEKQTITEAKLVKMIKAQNKEYAAQIAEKKASAMENTAGERAFWTGSFTKIIAGMAVGSVILGVIQWISALNKETNKSVTDMKSLYRQIESLKNPLSTVKLSFSDIDSLIQKITKDFPNMADQFNNLEDPAQKLGLAFGFIAEQSTKSMKSTWEFKDLIKNIGKWWRNSMAHNEWEIKPNGDIVQIPYREVLIQKLNKQTNALAGLNEQQQDYSEETELINVLLGAHNRKISDNLKTVNGLTAAWKKYKNILVETMTKEALSSELKPLYAELDQYRKEAIQYAGTPRGKEALVNMKSIAKQIKEDITTGKKTFTDMLTTGYNDAKQNATSKTKTASMTLVEYYTQLYNSYKTAAQSDKSYTKIALKDKNLLIKALKDEIASLDRQMKSIGSLTEKYKKLSLQKAKDIQQLTELINLREKLNSTWFNIPTAIIKPTKSQLAAATVYLSPQFHVNGQTIDEWKAELHRQIDQYDWGQGVQQGNEGGAL